MKKIQAVACLLGLLPVIVLGTDRLAFAQSDYSQT